MIIGVDLGGTNIRAGLVEGGRVTSLNQARLFDKESLQGTLSQLVSTISPLFSREVRGIGIGVPSLVDIERGIVYNVANIPSWERVELKKILEEEFRIPVFVNNDVNCLVLGEHTYGVARHFSSVVALALGTGLGAGIIINNSLYVGSNCGAGEIGSLTYLDSNFEEYTSSVFFESRFSTTALQAQVEAEQGSQQAGWMWNEYGLHLGNVIKAVMYMYDPQLIVLGGSISRAYPYFGESMYKALARFQYPESVTRLKILLSESESMAILGAATLAGDLEPAP
jgi:glucokinase